MSDSPSETSSRSAYVTGKLNTELFSFEKKKLNDYFKSTQYFFSKDYLSDGNTFLDIGGSSGTLADAIKTEVADIVPTVLDPDIKAIERGRKFFPYMDFYHGYFPEDLPKNLKFDVISMQALFPQIPNWKQILLALSQHTKKYLNLSLTLKLNGTTVVDKDVSYAYYLDSGERIYQVTHNIYELVNFCCIFEMGVKKIEFYGYHTPYTGNNFRCVPNSEQIKGNLMLEFFADDEENPIRMGGFAPKEGQKEYRIFIPEMNIIIDDKVFDIRNS